MRFTRILFVIASLMSLVVFGCSSITTQTPTTKEPATISYTSAIEPFLQAKCIKCHSSLSYDWAKKYSQSAAFTAGHWGANWTTLEIATISNWINGGMLP
jgi:hypothetical protein